MPKKPESRRWWIKLESKFFQDKKEKSMIRKCGYISESILLRMLLRSLDTDFCITFEGLEETLAEEISSDIDIDDLEAVEKTLNFMKNHELMLPVPDAEKETYFLPQAAEMSGSEGASAERMRNKRSRDRVMSQSDRNASQCSVIREEQENNQTQSYSDSESYSSESESENKTEQTDKAAACSDFDSAVGAPPPAPDGVGGAPPVVLSVDQLLELRNKHKVKLSDEGVRAFQKELVFDGGRVTFWGRPLDSPVKAMRGFAKNREQYQESEPWRKIHVDSPLFNRWGVNKTCEVLDNINDLMTAKEKPFWNQRWLDSDFHKKGKTADQKWCSILNDQYIKDEPYILLYAKACYRVCNEAGIFTEDEKKACHEIIKIAEQVPEKYHWGLLGFFMIEGDGEYCHSLHEIIGLQLEE